MSFGLWLWISVGFWVAVCVLALVRGGASVRLVATLLLVYLAWNRLHPFLSDRPPALTFPADMAATLVMSIVALRSTRYWTLAATSICLVGLGTDLAQMIAPVSGSAFGLAQMMWAYAFVLVLAIAALRTKRPSKDSPDPAAGRRAQAA